MRHTLVLICSLCVLAVSAGWTLIQATTANDNAVLLHADGTWTTHSATTIQRTVVLHPDGTWTYDDLPPELPIKVVSTTTYSKPDIASAHVAGEMVYGTLWYMSKSS